MVEIISGFTPDSCVGLFNQIVVYTSGNSMYKVQIRPRILHITCFRFEAVEVLTK